VRWQGRKNVRWQGRERVTIVNPYGWDNNGGKDHKVCERSVRWQRRHHTRLRWSTSGPMRNNENVTLHQMCCSLAKTLLFDSPLCCTSLPPPYTAETVNEWAESFFDNAF
jgi:hypothetical protein